MATSTEIMPTCICLRAYKGKGHPNIAATHETTLEVVEEARLTPRGDCIVCVSAKPSKKNCRQCVERKTCLAAAILIAMDADGIVRVEKLHGKCGDWKKPIIRASGNCRDAILCSTGRASSTLSREIIELLRSGFTRCILFVTVIGLDEYLEEEAQIPAESRDSKGIMDGANL